MTQFEQKQLRQLKLINAQLSPGAFFLKPLLIAILILMPLLYAAGFATLLATRGTGSRQESRPHRIFKGGRVRPSSYQQLVTQRSTFDEE